MASVSAVLDYVEHRTDLDVIAVTDHEDVSGGLIARELAAKRGYRFAVIAGAEVTTLGGHVVALFIDKTPPAFRRVESTLEMIHAQGGLAIVPHPLSWLTRSISKRTLDRIQSGGGQRFDAIELANPSPAGMRTRARAARLNGQDWGLPATGGSDAHHLAHLGRGWTEFRGRSTHDLRHAILSGTCEARMVPYPGLRDVGWGHLLAGLAWGYSATPRKLLRRRE